MLQTSVVLILEAVEKIKKKKLSTDEQPIHHDQHSKLIPMATATSISS